MDLVVGVDMATAAVRAVAAGADGHILAWAQAALPAPSSPRPGWSEQDAGTWWPAAATALKLLTSQLGPAASCIVALSVCATSGTVALLDHTGRPASPALMYNDQRAGAEAAIAQDAGRERWQRLGLHIQPSFGLPKLAWLLRERGDPAARACHPPDVVLAALTGRPAPADWSHALKSGFDPQRQEWAAEAMAALSIPPGALPEVGRPSDEVGRLDRAGAAATGLPVGCQVHLGMTDGCAAQLAAGGAAPGGAVSVLGTTLVLKTAGLAPVGDPSGAVYSHRHPDGWWLPGGASSTGARALAEWFPGRDLAALDEAAGRMGPATAVCYPLVGTGERFPFAAPQAQSFSLGEPPDDLARYRAILEGVAFVERLGYECLVALGAEAPAVVAVCGRASASRVWNRIRAAVLGVPLIEVPEASTALGACILAAAGSLHPDLATATAAMAARGPTVQPDQEDGPSMAASYQRFRDAVVARGWLAN